MPTISFGFMRLVTIDGMTVLVRNHFDLMLTLGQREFQNENSTIFMNWMFSSSYLKSRQIDATVVCTSNTKNDGLILIVYQYIQNHLLYAFYKSVLKLIFTFTWDSYDLNISANAFAVSNSFIIIIIIININIIIFICFGQELLCGHFSLY